MKPRALGDAHNFGRHVSVRGARISKPRPLLWEWLLLSAKSPLRRALREAARESEWGEDAFAFLYDVAFFPSKKDIGGEVERFELAPLGKLTHVERDELARVVGRSLALFSWLGVTDLHWENLVLGRDAKKRIVLAPLDVEIILEEFTLPTATKLLPDADPEVAVVCQHACGVRRVLPYLGKPVATKHLVMIASAYRKTLALLEKHAAAVAEVFAALPALRSTPIRVLLRGTDDYVLADTRELWPPLLDEEREQMARGDIPYFFRLYGKRGIHFYADASLRTVKALPLQGDVPQLGPALSVERNLRAPSRKKLREEGLFTVIAAFDHPANEGTHRGDDLEIIFRGRTLVVKQEGRGAGEMQARRDWSSFVSSVYLPCRCGEVRTVFVPEKTKCTDAGDRA